MVKLSKLYTKTGDDGTTGLVGGARTTKDALRVEAYGDVDELNAFIGWARTEAEQQSFGELAEELALLENALFHIGAELATDPQTPWEGMRRCEDDDVQQLERLIDLHTKKVEELRSFVLPGGTELNSRLHIARTVCRRAERTLLKLSRQEEVSQALLMYMNRLSDYLFALARVATSLGEGKEYLWDPGSAQPLKK